MPDGYVWLAYLTAYAVIAGYVATLWGRLRQRSRLEGSEQQAGDS